VGVRPTAICLRAAAGLCVAATSVGVAAIPRTSFGMAVGIGVAVLIPRTLRCGEVGIEMTLATVGVGVGSIVAEGRAAGVGLACTGADAATPPSFSADAAGLAIPVSVPEGVGVDVAKGTIVAVGAEVDVGPGVSVGVRVAVGIRVAVEVAVGTVDGTVVTVGSDVDVGPGVSVGVRVAVGACLLAVGVDVGTGVHVAVGEGVLVGVGDDVHVAVAGGVSVGGGAQISSKGMRSGSAPPCVPPSPQAQPCTSPEWTA
jgi:hypothetical protein